MESKVLDSAEAVKNVEESVIACASMAPHMIDSMSALLSGKDFCDETLGQVWDMVCDFRTSGIDPDARMLVTELKKRGTLSKLGGMAGFAAILDRAATPAYFEYYCREVVRYSELRRVFNAARLLVSQAGQSDADPQKILNAFMAKTEGVGNSKEASFVHLKDVISNIIAKKKSDQVDGAEIPGWSTGFPTLDSLIGAVRPGCLYLVGARTGIGKTAFAANMTIAAIAQEKAAWFMSLEMKNEEIAERIISSFMRLNHRRWRNRFSDSEFKEIEKFRDDTASRTRLWMTDVKESIQSIRAKCRLRKSLEGLDMLVVDNIQLVKPFDYRAPKHERIKQLSEAFKQLAKELDIAVVVLAQLAVDSEVGSGASGSMNEPDNSSWADSKRIPDDADVAMLLHRPTRESKQAKLIITKQRNGPLGNVHLDWEGEFQTFSDQSSNMLGGVDDTDGFNG